MRKPRMTANTASFTIRPTCDDDAEGLSALAHRIWHQHYPGIITVEQIDYMLGLWYTPDFLRQQIADPKRLFLVAEKANTLCGYIAASEQAGYTFIHKLYIADECRGQGLGQALLNALPKDRPFKLRVNRHNTGSIRFYQKYGFRIDAEDTLDIGNGYIMDDFIMVKSEA